MFPHKILSLTQQLKRRVQSFDCIVQILKIVQDFHLMGYYSVLVSVLIQCTYSSIRMQKQRCMSSGGVARWLTALPDARAGGDDGEPGTARGRDHPRTTPRHDAHPDLLPPPPGRLPSLAAAAGARLGRPPVLTAQPRRGWHPRTQAREGLPLAFLSDLS